MAELNPLVTPVQPSTDNALLHMLLGYRHTQVINVAAQLGLAEALVGQVRSSEDLAQETASDLDALRRLLRALTGLGLVAEVEPDRFSLTPLGGPLCKDAPDSIHHLAMLFAEEGNWRAWGDMAYSVRTGKSALEHVFGVRPFQYLSGDPRRSEIFNAAMAEYTRITVDGIVAAYDFSAARMVVDVGGNDGTLISAVLRRNPGLRGVLFDTPEGTKGARPVLEAAGVMDRCEIVEGDFFDGVPSGGDIYLLKSIVHDWNPRHAAEILRGCRKVIPDAGTLLVIEAVLPSTIGTPAGLLGTVLMDLNMLVTTGGRERTETEFDALLRTAGFQLTRFIQPAQPNSYRIMEATPA